MTNTLHFVPQTADESYRNARSHNHETRFLCLLHNDLLIDRNGISHQNSRVIRHLNMYALESLILNWWATVMPYVGDDFRMLATLMLGDRGCW